MKKINFNKQLQTRREFIKDTLVKVGTVSLGSYAITLLAACSDEDSDNPVGPKTSKGEITIDISKPENSALKKVNGSIAIAGNDIDSSGMLIVRTSETSVTALSRYCTHQGCTVSNFSNGISSCPCHGSKFNTSGSATQGPATKSLTKYTATISGNIITIKN